MKAWKALVFVSMVGAGGCAGGSLDVGQPAPEATVVDGFGMPLTVSSLKGNVVILDFWATWCGPCRMTMPALQRLHTQYRNKGLRVLGVTKESRKTINDFLQQNPYSYPMVIDANGTASTTYGATNLPLLFVIGKDGKIISKHAGAPLDEMKLVGEIETALAKP